MVNYFNRKEFKDLTLIDVMYKKGKFHILDGHHRYGYAKELGIKKILVLVKEIADNPITEMGFDSIDELIEQ
jgi:hypothetical protein